VTDPVAQTGTPPRRSPIPADVLRDAALVGAGVFVVSMTAQFRVPLLPFIGRDLAMSVSQMGLATTAFAAGRLVTDVPAGRSADRIPAPVAIGIAAVAMGLGSLLLTAARATWWVFVAFAILGTASALNNTTGMTYFSRVGDAASRGRALAVYSGCLLVGQALGPSLSGLIAGWGGWRSATTTAALLGTIMGVVMFLLRRPRTAQQDQVAEPDEAASSPGLPALDRVQTVVLHAIPFAMFYTFGGMAQTLVPIVGDDRLGLGAGAIGVALGIGGLCRFIGAFVGGVVSDRGSRKVALVPGMLGLATGVALLGYATTPATWVTAIVVMSLASYPNAVGATILADHGGDHDTGRRLGPYRLVGDLGLLAGPTVAGAVYQAAGGQGASLINAALLVTVAILCAVLLPAGHRPQGG
jgi:DHA1 family multidrug resistance protein-like MFS transporter